MNPPAGIEEIHAFEKRHNISLPEEYIAFLSQIGNGAKKSPWYVSEIYSLSDNESLANLDKPFLVQTKEDYQALFIDENGFNKLYGWKGSETIWEYLFKNIDYENSRQYLHGRYHSISYYMAVCRLSREEKQTMPMISIVNIF